MQTSRHDAASVAPDFLLSSELADAEPADSRRGVPDALITRAIGSARSALWRGPHAVLATVNARTRFRYTGVYRTDGGMRRNVALFDRENPMLAASGESVPLSETYCNIVAANALALAVADAASDVRLIGHPARGTVMSYVGVPVRDRGGRVVGTLCHWDLHPRGAPAGELLVLERVAELLAPLLGQPTHLADR